MTDPHAAACLAIETARGDIAGTPLAPHDTRSLTHGLACALELLTQGRPVAAARVAAAVSRRCAAVALPEGSLPDVDAWALEVRPDDEP